jgi:hypothetical protein
MLNTEMHENNPDHLHDLAQRLREVADKLDKVSGPDDMDKVGVICAFVSPRDKDDPQTNMIMGGNMQLCMDGHQQLFGAITHIAPHVVMGRLINVLRTKEMLAPPVKVDLSKVD